MPVSASTVSASTVSASTVSASTGPAPAIVIAGAGECGTRAAFALREQGWDGRVILAGAEPSPPYERPPLSKTGVALKSVLRSPVAG
jgi:hypothetical protein